MKSIRCSKCYNDNYSDGTYCVFCGANLYSTYSSNSKSSEKTKKSISKMLGMFLLRLIVLLISLVPGSIITVWSIKTTIECRGIGGDFQAFILLPILVTACVGIPLVVIAILGWRFPFVSGPIFTVVALGVAGYELSVYGHLQGNAMQFVLLFLVAGLLHITMWLMKNSHLLKSALSKFKVRTYSTPKKCQSFAHSIVDKCTYIAHEI